MIYLAKILFLFFPLFVASCDEEESSKVSSGPIVMGCTNSNACNYDLEANTDDGSCELNFFCYDADDDGMGFGDSTQICLDEIPNNWVVDCSDPTDDCAGIKDDCGECNGGNQNKDCEGICFGSNVLDINNTCCDNSKIQHMRPRGSVDPNNEVCLPEIFKWSLTMNAMIGEYEDDIFIPSTDSASFIIGTHYLSTDGLSYATTELQNSPPEGIEWIGNITYDYYGTKFIKLTFTLDSDFDHTIHSDIELNFNDEILYSPNCGKFIFSNNSTGECNVIDESFEYIFPVTFQGAGYGIPFSILLQYTFLY